MLLPLFLYTPCLTSRLSPDPAEDNPVWRVHRFRGRLQGGRSRNELVSAREHELVEKDLDWKFSSSMFSETEFTIRISEYDLPVNPQSSSGDGNASFIHDVTQDHALRNRASVAELTAPFDRLTVRVFSSVGRVRGSSQRICICRELKARVAKLKSEIHLHRLLKSRVPRWTKWNKNCQVIDPDAKEIRRKLSPVRTRGLAPGSKISH